MTTKPRAKKYRIRQRSAQPAQDTASTASKAPQPEGRPTYVTVDRPVPEEALAAIRAEGLSGRHMRIARRVAQKRGFTVSSDEEAVYRLRASGVDPFDMSKQLRLVGEGALNAEQPKTHAAPAQKANPAQLPSPTPRPAPPPAPHNAAIATGAREISDIQRDIAKRRRRRGFLLLARLCVFVLLPTILTGYYYFALATPMYSTKSEFVIQQADASTSGGGFGSLFAGTGLAAQQDSTQVQGFLQSRKALMRLDQEQGFKAAFSQPHIDAIQRLPADASNEAAYKLYKRYVKIGYDPSEGILKMEVIAPDPALSEAFSRALISYAEESVDSQTLRLREDQMRDARESFAESEAKMLEAQSRVLELQKRLGVFDPQSESSALMAQISTFETQLAEKRLQLQQLLDNARPNRARVEGVQGDISRLEGLIAQLRTTLTEDIGGAASLATISGELRIAEADLQTRQLMLQQALQQLETARIEANRQVRYLTLGVPPIAPDEASYPRAFENTLLAMLIFSGIYLMISMTATILKEQVSN